MSEEANQRMIRDQIVARGVADARVLAAFRATPRELFVPPAFRQSAYDDNPLPLAHGQTISQPFIVALMTELLQLRGDENVLEIGAGSGYQTAILARLARTVYSAELEPDLAVAARDRLAHLGIDNVELRAGDGVALFQEHAPFDAILSAAAPEFFPEALIDQLAEGGRCILPVGAADLQHLWLVEKRNGRVDRQRLDAVRFVPLREGRDRT
ncbi:MAG: protein-L-isoaspartate(D-aspartate) O-methyltransferase [Acidobacteria bacterium]|nr:protein-L-isoaspartate(D-aspartate) O-methyltransferase [Acidobacteriota bacterium]MBV9478305.1 protein-L-isoaspartate(D-aspartate) O-methyltransferase [Acidobacteriota bacterium]